MLAVALERIAGGLETATVNTEYLHQVAESYLNAQQEIIRLRAESQRRLELLREVEWSETYPGHCPKCNKTRFGGHAPACEVRAELEADND